LQKKLSYSISEVLRDLLCIRGKSYGFPFRGIGDMLRIYDFRPYKKTAVPLIKLLGNEWYCSCLSSARRSHNATRTRQRDIFETVRVREWNVFLIRRHKGGIGDALGHSWRVSLFQSWSPEVSPPLPPHEIFHFGGWQLPEWLSCSHYVWATG